MAENGEVSANQAADVHGVSCSTLKDRLKGRVTHETKSGPRPYLDSREEEELGVTGFGKRDSRSNVLLRTLQRRRAFLGQTIFQMGGGEGSWPDNQSLLFVMEM